jgi:hypothetical protein
MVDYFCQLYSYPPIADMKGQDIVALTITATLHLLLVIMTVGGEISMSALYYTPFKFPLF